MVRRTKISHLVPGFRVFVYGQEVTEDVLGIIINWSVGRNLSTCSIILSNERNKYLMTAADIAAMASRGLVAGITLNPSDLVNFLASSVVQDQLVALGEEYNFPVEEEGTFSNPTAEELTLIASESEFSVLDNTSVKNKVVSKKLLEKVDDPDTRQRVQIYDFFQGRSCFHPSDPVRIFFKEPDPDIKDPNTSDVPWYYGFAGFVSTLGESEDTKGQQTITLGCEDVLKNLRHSHIVPNHGLFEAPQLQELVNRAPQLSQAAFIYRNPVAGLNFTDGVSAVIFGTRGDIISRPVIDSNLEQQDVTIQLYGVGRFDIEREEIRRFGGEDIDSINLIEWLDRITNLVQKTDIFTIAHSSTPSLDPSAVVEIVAIEDIITTIGSDPFFRYPVEGTLRMLIPNEDNFALDNQVLTKEINNLIGNHLTLMDRLSILHSLVRRVGFELYSHPKGDIVIEFPLFDFYPSDFGEENLRDLILFDDRTEKIDTTYSDSNLRTIYLSKPVAGIDLVEGGQPGATRGLSQQAEVLDRLIPLYGIRVEPGDMDGALTTEGAALAWAKIGLRKVNSSIFTASVPMAFNPRFWLNRPYLWESRNHIGTAQKITHTLQWGSNASSSLGLAYMRGWKGQLLEDGIPLYEPIGGVVSAPLNYRELFFVPTVAR